MDEAEQEAAAAEAQRKLDEEKVVADKAAKAKWRADRKVGTSSTVRAFVRVPYECVFTAALDGSTIIPTLALPPLDGGGEMLLFVGAPCHSLLSFLRG